MSLSEMCVIVQNIEIATGIYEIVIRGELVQYMHEPGQFVHVKVCNELTPLLRRPLSIAKIDSKNSECTLIYRKQGKGTEILAKRNPGELLDVFGPLGHGFPVSEAVPGQTALLVGGGIGVPPLYELSSRLVDAGVNIIHVLGFQTANLIFYEQQFQYMGHTLIATDDGSYGEKGVVTDMILRHQLKYDIVYACGPIPMLKSLKESCSASKMFISLEERMGCGIGACYACICKSSQASNGHFYKKVCSDGPVFAAEEVNL